MPFLKATLIFYCMLHALSALSQYPQKADKADQPLRVEIPAKSDNETYRIIPCDSSGFIMFFRSLETIGDNQTKWYFAFYDRNFQQLWIKSLPLLSDKDFRFRELRHDTLFLFFGTTGKSKNPLQDFQILRVLLARGTFVLNQGKFPENSEASFFDIAGNRAWIGLNSKEKPGRVMTMNLSDGTTRSFVLGEGSSLWLRWFLPDSSGLSVSAIVTRQLSKKMVEHFLVRYDTNGSMLFEMPISTMAPDRNLTGFQVLSTGAKNYFICGTYVLNSKGSSRTNLKGAEESSGFFSTQVVGGIQKPMLFHNFLELKNANSLLSEKDILDLKKKALKKNRNLGEYSLDFSVLLHPLISCRDQLLFIGEVYYPQYHTENFTDFDYYGRPYTNSYSVFDGYRFINAIVAAFNPEGKLLWDNTLEIRNLLSGELSSTVTAHLLGDEMLLAYLADGKIGSKIIVANNVIEKLDFTPLEMMHPEDKLINESKSRMIPWYGNYFLCYGYQEIKNIALENNNKRLVFFVNKIRFER